LDSEIISKEEVRTVTLAALLVGARKIFSRNKKRRAVDAARRFYFFMLNKTL